MSSPGLFAVGMRTTRALLPPPRLFHFSKISGVPLPPPIAMRTPWLAAEARMAKPINNKTSVGSRGIVTFLLFMIFLLAVVRREHTVCSVSTVFWLTMEVDGQTGMQKLI